MSKSVLIIATLDTKGPEAAYIRDGLNRLGIKTTVIDTGILGEPLGITPDISHEDLAIFGGITLHELQNSGTRGRAVERMRTFVIEKVKELHSKGEVLGAIGIGGAEGSVMGAGALMSLPIGVPKLVLSPIASGRHEFGPLVGTSDMLVMHTVIDILGLNHISKTIYDNAVAAMSGLVNHGHELTVPPAGSKYVAVTMLGNTTTAVMALQKELEKSGFEVVTFHANGVGGPAMEELAEAGQFVGVIDFTPSEIVGTLVGGIHYGGPRRMKRVGPLGIPQILVPACVDFSVHHTTSISDEFKTGTFEILQTKPLTHWQIVGGKYISVLIVLLFVIVPTFIYIITIHFLSASSSIDGGGIAGSYLGLFLLAAVFSAISLCCSSYTSNAVVAFLISAFTCLILYFGFNAISKLPLLQGNADFYVEMFGIDFHYRSISRGVLDSRDLVYFTSIIFLTTAYRFYVNKYREKLGLVYRIE